MHPALKHALHHKSNTQPVLPDEYAVRLPPPPPVSRKTVERARGGRAGWRWLTSKTGWLPRVALAAAVGSPCACAPPPPLSLCIALSLHAGVCARVPGANVPVCIVLLQACRKGIHKISSGMEHPLGSTLP